MRVGRDAALAAALLVLLALTAQLRALTPELEFLARFVVARRS